MFLFLFLISAITSQALGGIIDDVKTVMTKCSDGVEPSDEVVNDFVYPNVKEADKCLHACVAKELGAMSEGKLKVEAGIELIKQFHPDKPLFIEKGPEILNNCYQEIEAQEDECEYVYNMILCIKKGREEILGEGK